MANKLSTSDAKALLELLEKRFSDNTSRHSAIKWADVAKRLENKPAALLTLSQMELTGGEPDVIGKDEKTGELLYVDCSAESPAGRRSICYDRTALDARKQNKPQNDAQTMAKDMGAELLDEELYRKLQSVGNFDTKTSSWIKTPENIRKLGGALFGDYRYGTVFIYHNGADSYYAARGFRALVRL